MFPIAGSPRRARLSTLAGIVAVVSGLALAAPGAAEECVRLEIVPHPSPFAAGEVGTVRVHGTPGHLGLLLIDTDATPSLFQVAGGIPIGLGQSSGFLALFKPFRSDTLLYSCSVECNESELFGVPFYVQALSMDPGTGEICVSNMDFLSWEDLNGECCGPCDGKVTALTLRYDGPDAAVVRVKAHRRAVVFEGLVQPGEEFTFFGNDKNGTFGPKIDVYTDGRNRTRIRTNCSKPIGPGLVAGDYTVVAGTSRFGGVLCAVP